MQRPEPDYDVEFANREPHRRRTKVVTSYAPERRTEHVSQTIIHDRPAQYIQAPRSSRSSVIIRPATPPAALPPPTSPRLELISVEETTRASPRHSRVSVSVGKGRSRHGSRSGEEVYIEREREVVMTQPPPRQDYETYRYVGGVPKSLPSEGRGVMTYGSNPRHSGRVVERERIVIEDDTGRRNRESHKMVR